MSSHESNVPDVDGRPIGFALVGLGRFATQQILPAFAAAEYSRPVAFVTGDVGKGRKAAQQHGVDPRHVFTYDQFELLADVPGLDVVYVLTPPALHAEYVLRAARIGKHVLVEKPMAPTERECRRMIAACAAAGRKLMVGYRVHYEPHNQRLVEWARGGLHGPVRYLECETTMPTPVGRDWRFDRRLGGGGALFDVGIYGLHAARWLTGAEPVEIRAHAFNDPADDRFHDVERTIVFQLRFPGGVFANCVGSFAHATRNRIRVVAADGWYELEPATTYAGQRLFHGAGDALHPMELPPVNQFAAELDHMAECVRRDRTPRTPGEEGRRDVRLMQLIYQSAQRGRPVGVPHEADRQDAELLRPQALNRL